MSTFICEKDLELYSNSFFSRRVIEGFLKLFLVQSLETMKLQSGTSLTVSVPYYLLLQLRYETLTCLPKLTNALKISLKNMKHTIEAIIMDLHGCLFFSLQLLFVQDH